MLRPACRTRCVGGSPQGGQTGGHGACQSVLFHPRVCLWALHCMDAVGAVQLQSPACPCGLLSWRWYHSIQLMVYLCHPLLPYRSRRGGSLTPGPPTLISSGGGGTCARRARCTSAATREAGRLWRVAACDLEPCTACCLLGTKVRLSLASSLAMRLAALHQPLIPAPLCPWQAQAGGGRAGHHVRRLAAFRARGGQVGGATPVANYFSTLRAAAAQS